MCTNTEVHYQPLAIEKKKCIAYLSPEVCIWITLVKLTYSSYWPEPKPVYSVVKKDMLTGQQLH